MKIIDARSGLEDIKIGQRINYPGGEWWKLVSVQTRSPWRVDVFVETNEGPKIVALHVRFMHPAFLFQRVGFYPS